jgi:spore maturation protein CgeB
MAGACQMIFVDSLEVLDYFNVDTEIVLCNNPSEFEFLLMDLLSNPEKRARIGAAARERCLKDHTYANRARRILVCTGILKLEENPFKEAFGGNKNTVHPARGQDRFDGIGQQGHTT